MGKRASGILMHVTSLPNSYGIGTFGREAYEFVDFLAEAGQRYWQLLPSGPTTIGDSPYQPLSVFAGNPYFIDLEMLNEEGILNRVDYENVDFGADTKRVDYGKIFINKMKVLETAYRNSRGKYDAPIRKFEEDNVFWIYDYSLYMALKYKFGLGSWHTWEDNIKNKNCDEVEHYRKDLDYEIKFWTFLQYIFFKQWRNLKYYANKKGIKIIGDIPIYAAQDSADTWSHREVFLADWVSGCPPDAFSDTGQLWGNPVYNWEHLKNSGYKWWIERLKKSFEMYDVTRIDHFRGFESFWQVHSGEKTAAGGKWVKGPGADFFNEMEKILGHMNIIAEDLGYLTEDVINFRKKLGYPGMKVLEFAFDPKDDSDYLPHNYEKNCVVYTGTHDNEPVLGWFQNASKESSDFAKKYFRLSREEGYNWGFIRGAMSSAADLAIIQIQDYIGLGNESRMNRPSTMGNNWVWRLERGQLTSNLAHRIKDITELYRR